MSDTYYKNRHHYNQRQKHWRSHKAGEYVRGEAHVNTSESVHAIMKRGVIGVYHSSES